VGGKSVLRQSGPAQFIRLPQALLKVGSQARWKLEYSGVKYDGTFTVEAPDSLRALTQRLQRENQGDPDEIVTKLRVASALSAEGYAWDARELIRTALTP
jgi:sirohydrochlorin ferrochelatase